MENTVYTTAKKNVTVTFTLAELQNLQRFHAQRQSRSDDGCTEAHIGYDVEQKLFAALKANDLPTTPSSDEARY